MRIAFSENVYPLRYQNVSDWKVLFLQQFTPRRQTTRAHYLEPGLNSSVPDFDEAMNLLIRERTHLTEILLL